MLGLAQKHIHTHIRPVMWYRLEFNFHVEKSTEKRAYERVIISGTNCSWRKKEKNWNLGARRTPQPRRSRFNLRKMARTQYGFLNPPEIEFLHFVFYFFPRIFDSPCFCFVFSLPPSHKLTPFPLLSRFFPHHVRCLHLIKRAHVQYIWAPIEAQSPTMRESTVSLFPPQEIFHVSLQFFYYSSATDPTDIVSVRERVCWMTVF